MRFVTRIMMISCLSMLVACDLPERAPASPKTEVGTRAYVKGQGKEVIAQVTKVKGKLVTVEILLDGERVAIRDYYRGLVVVSGTESGVRYESEVNQAELETLFPLKVGNQVSLPGITLNVDRGTRTPFHISLQVVDETTLELLSGARRVFVVDMQSRFEKDGETINRSYRYYFDPEISMTLKTYIYLKDKEQVWRTVSIELPGERKIRPTPEQRLRSGTVMI